MIQIYHNNRCSKSRECLALLSAQSNTEIQTIDYLKQPPTVAELEVLLSKLGMEPIDLVRKGEKLWAPFKTQSLTREQVLTLLADHPVLIERPIVVYGDKAVVARPTARALEILPPHFKDDLT